MTMSGTSDGLQVREQRNEELSDLKAGYMEIFIKRIFGIRHQYEHVIIGEGMFVITILNKKLFLLEFFCKYVNIEIKAETSSFIILQYIYFINIQ